MNADVQKIMDLLEETSLVLNATSEELDKLRKKYGVPKKDGKTVNSDASKIFGHVKSDGLDRGKWNAPSSQTARYEALSKASASTWRDGFFQVEDGDLKYPYINKSGKAMVSGIIAVRQRASAAGDNRVFEVAGKVMEKIEAAEGDNDNASGASKKKKKRRKWRRRS